MYNDDKISVDSIGHLVVLNVLFHLNFFSSHNLSGTDENPSGEYPSCTCLIKFTILKFAFVNVPLSIVSSLCLQMLKITKYIDALS